MPKHSLSTRYSFTPPSPSSHPPRGERPSPADSPQSPFSHPPHGERPSPADSPHSLTPSTWRTSLTLLIGPQETCPQASLSGFPAGVTLATNSCHESAAMLCIHAHGDNLFCGEPPMHNTLENNLNVTKTSQKI